MKISLINPPQYFTKTQITAGVVPPLGVMYLSSYLKNYGIDVKLIDSVGDKYYQYTRQNNLDIRGMTFEQITDSIGKHTDIIGLSAHYSFSHKIIKELIEYIKFKFPNSTIVLGGAHSTMLPEFILNDTKADIIVSGEGEETLLDLCRNLSALEQVKGIIYKNKNQIIFNEQRDLIKNLDMLSFPDFDSINMQNYFSANEPHGCSKTGKWTTILSSRGCPYKCTFCSTPKLWRSRWRPRSPQNVIAEMMLLNRKYGINDFHFEDENMGLDKKWMHQFTDLLIEGKYNFLWQPSNGLRAENLDDEICIKMKKSGCSLIVVTLESASERVRNEIIKKQLNISSVESAIKSARKAKLKTTCYFMIGLPGETEKEARETIYYSAKLAINGLDECVIGIFSLLPGTELFKQLSEQGKVKLDDDFFENLLSMGDLKKFKSWTEFIDDNNLKKIRTLGYLSFAICKTVFHPFKVIKSLINIMTGRYELKSERVAGIFFKR